MLGAPGFGDHHLREAACFRHSVLLELSQASGNLLNWQRLAWVVVLSVDFTLECCGNSAAASSFLENVHAIFQ